MLPNDSIVYSQIAECCCTPVAHSKWYEVGQAEVMWLRLPESDRCAWWWPFLANTKLIECGPHVAFNADLILCADAHKACSDLRYERFSVVVICLVEFGF